MKILVVDDSIVFRSAIKMALMDSGQIDDVETAPNGQVALDKIKITHYDAVTLDIEMPIMDGIDAIKEIRLINKDIPIIVFSALSVRAVKKTLEALAYGANDFISKLSNNNDLQENIKGIREELLPRIFAFNKSKKINPLENKAKTITNNKVLGFKPDIICIGSSTGGPETLKKIFFKLGEINVPILLVQHMPPVFTEQLASALNKGSRVEVSEAKVGDILEAGKCYLAPGDFHMRVKRIDGKIKITLDQKEKVCYVRPAYDCLLESVSELPNLNVANIILTGMGSDGAGGTDKFTRKNLLTIIQDEESSIVWGMPRAVHDRGLHDEIVNLDEIAGLINKLGAKGQG
jgi:two-component system chemotaxis response regulator CheB